MRIAFKSWHSKESLILFMHSFFLILRTVLSVGVARLDGRLVRDIVSADGKGFLRGLGLWFLLAIPSTYTNTMVRYPQYTYATHLTFFPDSPLAVKAVPPPTHSTHTVYPRLVPFLFTRLALLSCWSGRRSRRRGPVHHIRYISVL